MKNDGQVYSLDNPYLSLDQKVVVESWFQLPGDCMQYAFWIASIYSVNHSLSVSSIIGIAFAANLIAGLTNWFVFNERFLKVVGLSIFHPFVTGAIGIGVAIFLYFHDAPTTLVGISAFSGIFGFLFLELHIILYVFFAKRHGLHPKYVFAKKHFGLSFPFEQKAR